VLAGPDHQGESQHRRGDDGDEWNLLHAVSLASLPQAPMKASSEIPEGQVG
jgi:hypothetical protein